MQEEEMYKAEDFEKLNEFEENKSGGAEFDYEIVNKRILPLAEQLIAKFDELKHIDPKKILFILNHKNTGSKNHIVLAHTTRIPQKWTELMYQLAGVSYFYKIEFYAKTTAALDESQMTALLYSELRRIGPEGKMLVPDVHDWWQVVIGLGRKWFYPNETCANLLDEGVDWKKLMGQFYEDIRTKMEEFCEENEIAYSTSVF